MPPAAGDQGIGKVYRMTFERLSERVTKSGLLTTEDADQFLADIQSPEFGAVTGFHCAAWGANRPHNESEADRAGRVACSRVQQTTVAS